MTAQPDPYVRIYYRVLSDPKFVDVIANLARFGLWVRLLLLADGTFPAPAPIPAFATRRPTKADFDALASCGLIDVLPGEHYAIHGLAFEREMRSQSGRNAAAVRWQSEPNALRSSPLRTDPNRATPSNSDARDGSKNERPKTGLTPISDLLRGTR